VGWKKGSSRLGSFAKSSAPKTGLLNFGDWSFYALIVKVLLVAGVVLYLPLRIQEQAVLRKVNTPVLAGTAETRAITITNATKNEAQKIKMHQRQVLIE